MTHTSSVIVIGGGIIGICSALSLVERGFAVKLIDRDPIGQGASMGNAGVISPYSVLPQSIPGLWKNIPRWILDPKGPISIRPGYIPQFLPWAIKFLNHGTIEQVTKTASAMHLLNHDNMHLYRRLLFGTGFEYLVQDSYYVYAYRDKSKARLDSLDNNIRRKFGAKILQLDAAELSQLEPALSTEFQSAIVVEGQARALSPGKICNVFAEKFLAMGGLIERCDVRAIMPEPDGWVVKTNTGILRASKVVLAAGAWSMKLLAPLGITAPLEAERGYHVIFKNPSVELKNSVMDMDMKFVASSMDMGFRAAGTAEFSGLGHSINPKRLTALEKAARLICPDLIGGEIETWSGVRPSFPDSLPVIGNIPGYTGLIGAFGHSHWGFMMGPKTGQIVADLVSEINPNINLDPFSLTRFKKFV